MSIYILKLDNNIIGVFNDLQLAIDYSYSISKAELLLEETIKIYKYKKTMNLNHHQQHLTYLKTY